VTARVLVDADYRGLRISLPVDLTRDVVKQIRHTVGPWGASKGITFGLREDKLRLKAEARPHTKGHPPVVTTFALPAVVTNEALALWTNFAVDGNRLARLLGQERKNPTGRIVLEHDPVNLVRGIANGIWERVAEKVKRGELVVLAGSASHEDDDEHEFRGRLVEVSSEREAGLTLHATLLANPNAVIGCGYLDEGRVVLEVHRAGKSIHVREADDGGREIAWKVVPSKPEEEEETSNVLLVPRAATATRA
jgi:hypothetical protein